MRVIAGDFKGRQLKAVPGTATRPTTDKIKEAIFQRIGPFFDGGTVLDLYAGSGSLGIEALSRGMDEAIFVDIDRKAIHTIKDNLETVKAADRAEIFRADAHRALKACGKRGLTFDLILLDPPYRSGDFEKLFKEIFEYNLIRQDGIIYCEHDPREQLPETGEQWTLLKNEKYSNTIETTIYKAK